MACAKAVSALGRPWNSAARRGGRGLGYVGSPVKGRRKVRRKSVSKWSRAAVVAGEDCGCRSLGRAVLGEGRLGSWVAMKVV